MRDAQVQAIRKGRDFIVRIVHTVRQPAPRVGNGDYGWTMKPAAIVRWRAVIVRRNSKALRAGEISAPRRHREGPRITAGWPPLDRCMAAMPAVSTLTRPSTTLGPNRRLYAMGTVNEPKHPRRHRHHVGITTVPAPGTGRSMASTLCVLARVRVVTLCGIYTHRL